MNSTKVMTTFDRYPQSVRVLNHAIASMSATSWMSRVRSHSSAQRLGKCVSSALALLATSLVLSPAYAIDTGFRYEINPQHNFGKCLDVSEASKADGAKLIQFQCNDQKNQRFRFRRIDGNRYEIRAVHSNKCLDVRGAATGDGVDLIQFRCNGRPHQQFRLLDDTDSAGGTSRIQAEHSKKCLDVKQSSNADTAEVIQFTCHGGLNQRFDLGAFAN